MFVIVPVIAMSLSNSFQFPQAVGVALIALSISPLPPLIPKKLVKSGGRESYAISLIVTVGSLSILIVPLAVEILER
jgi:bile acid:Na+ symporter, BASS family